LEGGKEAIPLDVGQYEDLLGEDLLGSLCRGRFDEVGERLPQ